MLVLPLPQSAALLEPGQVFFSLGEGYLSHNIAMETGQEPYQAGLLVPTHCGIVLEDGYVAEAWYPRFRVVALHERLEKREPLVWLKTPAGQTRESAEELCRRARELEGVEYDAWGVLGFTLSDKDDNGQSANRLEDPAKHFCSEGVDLLLRATEHLRTVALPKAWKLVHPSWRSPQGLNVSPIWG
ncbi:hypothetical protein AAU61_15005 [Desulfocarbo indianensis]|nr:hypothetical protein AAU61_15005 [Desulfocarbo indianensis]